MESGHGSVADGAGAGVAVGGRVERDIPCAGCGYNLRSLGVGAACPECGLGVGRSLAAWAWRASPELRRARLGIWLLIACTPWAMLHPYVAHLAGDEEAVLRIVGAAWNSVGAVCWAIAVWLFVTPAYDPGNPWSVEEHAGQAHAANTPTTGGLAAGRWAIAARFAAAWWGVWCPALSLWSIVDGPVPARGDPNLALWVVLGQFTYGAAMLGNLGCYACGRWLCLRLGWSRLAGVAMALLIASLAVWCYHELAGVGLVGYGGRGGIMALVGELAAWVSRGLPLATVAWLFLVRRATLRGGSV